MTPQAIYRELRRKVRQVGLLATAKHVALRLWTARIGPPDQFDRQYGTDTASIVPVGALDISNEAMAHATRYEAVRPEELLARLEDVPHEGYTFIDIGSGKGRALLLASLFPFRRIIGVEISQRFTNIARKNIEVFRDEGMRCKRIEALCWDAADYSFPPDDLVIYLYNPFDADLMRKLVDKIGRSLQVKSRQIYVIYRTPNHRTAWDESGEWEVVKESGPCVIYRRVATDMWGK
jgi:SAM-dependent methyltransferase